MNSVLEEIILRKFLPEIFILSKPGGIFWSTQFQLETTTFKTSLVSLAVGLEGGPEEVGPAPHFLPARFHQNSALLGPILTTLWLNLPIQKIAKSEL